MQENDSFISFPNHTSGLIFDQSDHKDYPLQYFNVIDGQGLRVDSNCSYYIYVYEGTMAILQHDTEMSHLLKDGMFMSLTGDWSFGESDGKAIAIEVFHQHGVYPETKYRAVTHIGGPIEKEGRLKYIDGCTDSLLIPPVKLGDPCLNHLHFPDSIDQTPHTHPSHRIGIVAKGNGQCVTPFGDLPLTQGMIFVIKEWDGSTYAQGLDGEMYPNGTHKFRTFDEAMDVIAFHPDSDFGPTDIEHPMINRTIVDGVPASQLEDIRTK